MEGEGIDLSWEGKILQPVGGGKEFIPFRCNLAAVRLVRGARLQAGKKKQDH